MSRLSVITSVVVSSLLPLTAQVREAVPILQTRFDAVRGTLAVRAPGVPLSAVLAQLRTQHGIGVTVVDPVDSLLDVDLREQPLQAALRQLLGDGKRFLLELPADLVLPPEPLVVQRARAAAPAPEPIRPEMPAGIVEQFGLPPAVRPAMPAPAVPVEVPPPPPPVSTHAVLLVRLRADAAPVVERICVGEGEPVIESRLRGDWVWDATIDGKVVAFGSLPDPFAVLPLVEGRPRDGARRPQRTREAEALVALSTGAELLDAGRAARAVIRFRVI